LEEYSPEAKVFVLVHKMDLVGSNCKSKEEVVKRRQLIFEKRTTQVLERSGKFKSITKCFPTTIWDSSLEVAWTDIISSILVDKDKINSLLSNLGELSGADEVMLFEKSTFLLVSHHTSKPISNDSLRFEKISSIIKRFKLAFYNLDTRKQFETFSVRTKDFITHLEEFTSCTYIMIVVKDVNYNLQLLTLNLDLTRDMFEKLTNVNKYIQNY
jgi:Ras-related GTP-binding protein A/B